ncbi:peptidase M18 [Zopfochytrium polystomum]|nr:peptidase M18 [Zopfochytrium polystomum]
MSAADFLSFVRASPSPFHAVAETRARLDRAGFLQLSERSPFRLLPSGKYYLTRNQSSIVAFAVGGRYKRGNGFSIVGAHTDSPCLKVKPKSGKEDVGYAKVGVELYGGGLWHTWFDRDLGVAGRVILRKEGGGLEHKLVRLDAPILKIPTLAIHLDRSVSEGFKFNNEVHLTPMIASAEKNLNEGAEPSAEKPKHSPLLLKKLAKELNVDASAIGDFELCLYDTQPPAIGGAEDEFIFSARLDNLMSSYCAITALIRSVTDAASGPALADDTNLRVVALFDNEEVGSNTMQGADSNLLESVLRRLALAEIDGANEQDQAPVVSAFDQAMTKSLLISADMAHAVHPNYSEKHEANHRPAINKGIVVKQNANQRYATTAVTTAIVREVAKKRSVPLQEFVVRNDSPCGSTIGPMLSSKLGLRTIDVGNPQLSMHSIRETCGTQDVKYAVDLFQSFFEEFPLVEAGLVVD